MIKHIPATPVTLPKMIFVFLAIMFISGCAPYRGRISGSPVGVPPSYSMTAPAYSAPAGRWWEQFGDDTLNRLTEEAFRYNLDIAQAYERLMQSRAIVNITDASRWPVLNIEGAGGKTRQSGLYGMTTSDTFSLSAAASYEIDLWGKLSSRTDAARLDAIASEESLKALFISISAQIADLYFLAAEQQAQLALSDETIASFKDTLDMVESRYRGGLVPAVDVYQSRQNLASARAQRPVFESNLAVTRNALAVMTGRFPDRKTGENFGNLTAAPSFGAGLPSQLLTDRPDLKSGLLRLRAADSRVAAAVADRFPSFSLVGRYGGASDEVRSVLDSPNILWNVLLQAVQPVIDSGRRKAEVARSESVVREYLASYHKTVITAFQEVEDALSRISASEQRLRMLDETVSASESSLRLSLDRYMQGLTDYLPVLTEQLRHFNAKSSLLAAKRQLISDQIQLARALGGDWSDQVMEQYMKYKNTGENTK
ncbi:MAG: efflux transporter outer membrane subunit [Nitrospirota bacterium]